MGVGGGRDAREGFGKGGGGALVGGGRKAFEGFFGLSGGFDGRVGFVQGGRGNGGNRGGRGKGWGGDTDNVVNRGLSGTNCSSDDIAEGIALAFKLGLGGSCGSSLFIILSFALLNQRFGFLLPSFVDFDINVVQ